MDKLDTSFMLDNVRDDVANGYDSVCLLIGHQIMITGHKDKKLVAIASKLSSACELMRRYSSVKK